MSLQYRSIATSLIPWFDEDEKNVIMRRAEHLGLLFDDQIQLTNNNIYDALFKKLKSVRIGIDRSERYGIIINITYILIDDTEIKLEFLNKKSREILLTIDTGVTYEKIDPSITLQKLFLDRLPVNIKKVLMYYIYNPTKHNWLDIEQYTGPVKYNPDNILEKIKTNYPPNWRMNNKWDEVTNFIFSLIEAAHHTKYEEGFAYQLILNLRVCKQMCRQTEESIVLNKTFARSY